MSSTLETSNLSPPSDEMLRAIRWAEKHGGKIHRHPGGFWGSEKYMEMYGPWFGTPTMEGLVKRDLAEYTKWQDGRNGRFPIEVTIKCARP